MADYWQERRFQLLEQMESDEAKLNSRLSEVYAQQEALLKRDIAAYYAEYGENKVIEYRNLLASLSEADRRLLMERMDEFAKKYPQYAHLMPIRESIYRLDRLEGLQYSIWLQQMEIGAIEQDELTAHFESYAQKSANLAAEELGFGTTFYAINSQVVTATVGAAWAQGENFSQRIWGNRQKLAAYLSDDLAKGFARGMKYEDMAKMLMERFDGVSKRDAMRLVYTEGTFIFNEAQAQVHEQQFEYYQLSTITDPKTCSVCKGVERAQRAEPMAFKDRKPGVNFPPIHPNCVMGDMKLVAPGMEAMTRSYYSGEIVELRTANGRRLAVTPNHIVLTSRGWVRAKSIVEGDQVINYTGGVVADVESAPTQNDSVAAVEERFASLVESGTVTTISMPAASEHFKGDVVPDSEVDIVFINGFLGDEGDTPVNEYVGDGDFIGAAVSGEIPLTGQCSMAKLLVGISLASDGIMSGSGIARIISSGALTHHELVGLCDVAHYDSRIAQSALNGRSGEAETVSDGLNAGAGLVQGDHFGEGKKRTNGNGSNSENIRDFINAFSGVVEFDDVVFVRRFQFAGHVYDASTESRTYVCNGIITSNCRCSYTVAVPDWDAWIDEQVEKSETPKQQVEQLIDIDDIEGTPLNPERILPVNQIAEWDNFYALAYDFKHSGYSGRPIVAIDLGEGTYQALTGSHRTFAAREAGIDIPVVIVEYNDKTKALLGAFEDEERAEIAKRLLKSGDLDRDAARLLMYEDTANGTVSEEFRKVSSKKAELYKAEKAAQEAAERKANEASKKAQSEAAKQFAEEREKSAEMSDYKTYLRQLETKYGDDLWSMMTDDEMERLDALERLAYKGV